MKTKRFIIVSLIGLLLISFGFMTKKSQTRVIFRALSETSTVAILPVSSEDYANLMGEKLSENLEYNESFYFLMKISNDNNNPLMEGLVSKEEFGSRVNYLSNDIAKDLSIIQGVDTIPCSMAHWERTYDLRKDITLNLMFRKKNNTTASKLIWNDQLISGLPVKFKLD